MAQADSQLMTGGCLITQICKLCSLPCALPCAVSSQENTLQECENFNHFCPGLNETGECGAMPRSNWFGELHQGLQQHLPLLTEQGPNLVGGRRKMILKLLPHTFVLLKLYPTHCFIPLLHPKSAIY